MIGASMIRRLAVALALLALAPLARAQESVPRLSVSYTVDVSEPEGGKIHVAMAIERNTEEEVTVAMPAWAPGAYRIVKYGKTVWNVAAQGKEGAKLAVVAVDEQTWRIRAGRAPTVTVSYDVTVERGRLNKDHCFLAGPDTYLYVSGRKEAPSSVRFKLPSGWKVGTGLEKDGEVYRARDYDTFIDCPTELGKFELLEFEQDQAKYQLVIHSRGAVDGPKLAAMCRKIVREQNRIFGGPPFDRYVFLYHFGDGVGGRGLEHLNSTDISMMYMAVKADPLLSASVTSHEYFHLWNVKRIRPSVLGPFDYTGPVRTKALWFCEGVTSYFGDRTLARCGIWSEGTYLAHLAGEVESLQNNPDRKVTSVEKASWTVWDRRDYPRVDYYNKGELLGLLIDLKLRTDSGGKRSLDDVLRHLYDAWVVGPSRAGKGWIGVGYPEDGILKALNEVSGGDWSGFFDKYVGGVEELPYEEILRPAGLDVSVSVLKSPDLGVDLRGTIVAGVPPGSEPERAGVKGGDRITSVNGDEVTRTNIREAVAKLKVGETAKLELLRGTETVQAEVKVGVRERTGCRLRRSAGLSEGQKAILDGWLARPADY
jgi:predicted metalloprotease with PDZ domain